MSTPDRREPPEGYHVVAIIVPADHDTVDEAVAVCWVHHDRIATRAALQAKRELLEELIAECERLSSEHYQTKTTSISAKAYHKSRSKRWGHWASWLRMKLLALPTKQEREGGHDAT